MIKNHKKLERLMLFSAVARNLNFTLAANQLGISKGHLSAQIRQLEQDMGMPLLIRTTRSVRLTAEGERVFNGMESIERNMLELERNALSEATQIQGEIKITAPVQFTERYLLNICQQFKQVHPAIEFIIDCSYTAYDLNKSNFDIAFRATNQPPENMIAKALMDYQQSCCAAPSYLQKRGYPTSLAQLNQHQCLSGQDQQVWQFANEKININGWLKVNNNHLLKQQALEGQGIIYVPSYLVEKEIGAGKLDVLFADKPGIQRTIYAIYPQLIQQPIKLTAFIEFTKSYFDKI